MRALVSLIAFALVPSLALAEGSSNINSERAQFHYQMHCQGCHTENGRGFGDVPKLKGFVGNFLKIEEGRRYLVQVPGSANAYLNDAYLAELLNWMMIEFSQGSLPKEWQAYSEAEVTSLRKTPLMEVFNTRQQLLKKIQELEGI